MTYKWIPELVSSFGLLICPSIRAGIIDVTFVSNALAAAPGDILPFQGSLVNNSGSDVFINGAGITLTGFGPTDTDITDFILNATGLLGNGVSIGPVDLFTVTVPSQFATGQYLGILSIQGGPTLNDDSLLGTASFEVNVNAVPESGSFSLMAGTLFLVLLLRRVLRPGRRNFCA